MSNEFKLVFERKLLDLCAAENTRLLKLSFEDNKEKPAFLVEKGRLQILNEFVDLLHKFDNNRGVKIENSNNK